MKNSQRELWQHGYALCCCIALLSSVVLSEPIRWRRQTTRTYVIDTLVVVDDRMFSRFEQWLATTATTTTSPPTNEIPIKLEANSSSKIKEYVSLVVHQANDRFATLGDRLSYTVSLQVVNTSLNVDVLSKVLSPFTSGRLRSEDALEAFRHWIIDHNLDDKYDHAVLLTGYQLTSDYEEVSKGTTKGRAYTGQMCNQAGYSASIVEDILGFQSVLFVAHEVGHSLGSPHDGERESVTCKPQNNYIMTPTLSNAADRANLSSLYNPWFFSHCSVNAIDNLVDTLTSTVASNDVSTPPNCFRTESDPIPEFLSTSNIIAGQAYPANVQCQMIYGPDSRVCHARSFGNTSDICTSMYCYDPSEITASGEAICKEHLAAEGTSCGDRKWCQRGRCVASENAPVIGDCPYGDEVTILKTQLGDYKCSELIDMFGKSQCYDPETERTCCGSCGKVRRDSQVCPYGDRAEDCSKSRCHQVFSDGKTYAADYCCETCSYNGCADVTEIDGVTCDARVQQDGFQGCYNDTVAYHCCKTCADLRTNKPDCQYGDRILGSFCSINGTQDQRAQKCADRDDVCCESCQGAGSASHLRWTSSLTTVMLTMWFYWNNVTGL